MTTDFEAVLAENIPVVPPELPPTLRVSTAQQFKALGDVTRSHILSIIKYEPVTAKQIGARLNISPSTVGHHLQVLEAAGLAQIVARRLVHGIVAKYYMRTARLFQLDFPSDIDPETKHVLHFLTRAREEMADVLLSHPSEHDGDGEPFCITGFPHARLSRERAEEFRKRLWDLVYEFATAPSDPEGQVYGLCTAFFQAPSYLQEGYVSDETGDLSESQ